MVPLILSSIFIHFIFIFTLVNGDNDSIYEILKAHGLPTGLLPKGITRFDFDDSGRFVVHLDQPCKAKFESEMLYKTNVSGTLSYGQIGALSGISAQELFLWFPVQGIRVDVPTSGLIYFDVGVVSKQFSLSLFETPRVCKPGSITQDVNLLSDVIPKVVIDSVIVPVSAYQVLPTGKCILAQGVLGKPSTHGKQTIELKVDKVLHIGTVEQDTYPLSRKRLPLDSLRDYSHIRPRTTTVFSTHIAQKYLKIEPKYAFLLLCFKLYVASVTRIRSALNIATRTFFLNHGFLHVQVPVITITDSVGFSAKFQFKHLM